MIKQVFKKIISSTLIVAFIAVFAAAVIPTEAFAQNVFEGVDSARGDGVPGNLTSGDGSIVTRAINLLLYAVGVISVIMLIFGGFRYVISGGQKEAVTAAKNTILYAIVGLLVAVFSYAIISFVLNAVIGGGGTDV